MSGKSIISLILVVFSFNVTSHSQVIRSRSHEVALGRGELPYCRLLETDNIKETIVHTSTVLYIPAPGKPRVDGDGEAFYYSSQCNNRDFFARADLSRIQDEDGITSILRNAFQRESPLLVEVKLIGRLSAAPMPVFGHHGWLRAQIIVSKIKSAKILSKYPHPDLESDAPMLETANSLQFTNSQLITGILDRGFVSDAFTGVIRKTSKVSIDVNAIGLSDHRLSRLAGMGATIRVSTEKISKYSRNWSITGSIEILYDGQTNKAFYNNQFFLESDNAWRLIQMDIRSERPK